MNSASEIKTKCYILLDGLERSLAENLVRSCLVDSPDFLTVDEKDKTLDRLREDIKEPSWKFEDSSIEDLIQYLDLGDLVGILNRNALTMKNVVASDVKEATSLIAQSEALSIRKRVMHPVRPLEVDDFPKLLQLATILPGSAPSMHWDPLSINVRRLSKGTDILEVSIPSYWAEDSLVVDNLPAAEFDDTGFIGRFKDRRDLRKWLESEHRVITVVGEAGVGKTALSLRVCNDIVEDSRIFDRVVWVSLKTKYLTPEGVRQIQNAIDSFALLTDHLAESFPSPSPDVWQNILAHMKSVRTLLVIDNMETIGNELRDFLVNIPADSKVLLTSRVGLGEIEARYELAGFSPKDSVILLNTLISVYNCKPLKNTSQQTLTNYANRLGHNPLLLKWFILAICKGTDPAELLSKGLEESLEFFYTSVYERLGQLSKHILSVILAARKGLTKPQLQELTNSSHVSFSQAIQELVRSSMVDRYSDPDGTVIFTIRGLVYEFLSKHSPPTNEIVKATRGKLKEWQTAEEESTNKAELYRYSVSALQIQKTDERIVAPHLLRAISAARRRDPETAIKAIASAVQLTPTWSEVYRVKAFVLIQQNAPIYEIEKAFEDSLSLRDNDVTRYYYAAYLLNECDYDRSIEQIEAGLKLPSADQNTFRSLKGLALIRKGKVADAIPEMKYAWVHQDPKMPKKIALAQGTQLGDAYKRLCENECSLGHKREALEACIEALKVLENATTKNGLDKIVCENIVDVYATGLRFFSIPSRGCLDLATKPFAGKLDQNSEFVFFVAQSSQTVSRFQQYVELKYFFPITARHLEERGLTRRMAGSIISLFEEGKFGFIESDTGHVHFNESSLLARSQWPTLKVGSRVTFEIVPAPDPRKTAHAIRLDITNEVKSN